MRITTRGWKGRDVSVELGRLTVLSGPNGAGKSSVADAVRFGALGYVPHLGKRPADTAALIRNGAASVEIGLDGGRRFSRALERIEGGKLTTRSAASWLKAKESEHEAAILSLFGASAEDVAESLDIRQLLAATPQQRGARIMGLLEAGQASAADRLAAVARGTVQRLVGIPDERMPANYREAMPMVGEGESAALKAAGAMLEAKVGAGLEAALAWSNEEKRRAALDLDKRRQAAAEIERRLASLPAAAGDAGKLEAERARLEREIGAARERIAEAKRRAGQIAEAREEVEARRAQVKRLDGERKTEIVGRDMFPDGLDYTPEGLAVVQARLDSIAPPAAGALSGKVADARKKVRSIEEALAGLPKPPEIPDTSEAVAEANRLSIEFETAKDSPWAEIAAIGKALSKSTTETARKHGNRLQALAKKHAPGDVEEIEALYDRAATQADEAVEEEGKAKRAGEKIAQKREALELDRQKALADLADTQDAEDRARRNAAGKFEAERAELVKERDAIQSRLDALHAAQEARDHAASALEHAEKRVRELGPAPEAPAANGVALTDAEDALDHVRRALSALGSAAAVKSELGRIVKEIAGLDAARKVFAAIEESLKRAREAEIAGAGGPLIERMGIFLRGAGLTRVPYFRASKAAVDVGWRDSDGAAEVTVGALSGGEWCLFAAALTAAVLVLRGAPVRVLLVEAGETDEATLGKLLAGCAAVAGDLTSVVVMCQRPVSGEVLPEGAVVVNMSPLRLVEREAEAVGAEAK